MPVSLFTSREVVFAHGSGRGLFLLKADMTHLSFARQSGVKLAMACALALGAAPSFAVPVYGIHAEELIAMAPDLRKSLSLNANQQTLWGQVDGRSRAILRERAARHERLQK